MATCFSCGAESPFPTFSCDSCQQLKSLACINKSLAALTTQQVATDKRKLDISLEQCKLLKNMESALRESAVKVTNQLSTLTFMVQRELQQVHWDLQQQSELLASIDHTLKTPSETQANEWRVMGVRLAARKVDTEAEQFFRKSLEMNPLDYRVYIGLANVVLRQNRFDEAYDILERSLPHAPSRVDHDEVLSPLNALLDDFKSYTLLTQGQILACQNRISESIIRLKNACDLSPKFADARYELARQLYFAEQFAAGGAALVAAIDAEPIYFELARRDTAFRRCASSTKSVLQQVISQTIRKGAHTIKHIYKQVDEMERLLTHYDKEIIVLKQLHHTFDIPPDDYATRIIKDVMYASLALYRELKKHKALLDTVNSNMSLYNNDLNQLNVVLDKMPNLHNELKEIKNVRSRIDYAKSEIDYAKRQIGLRETPN